MIQRSFIFSGVAVMLDNRLGRILTFLGSLILMLGIAQDIAFAQYTVTNLVANKKGKAKYVDSELVDAWGIAYAPRGPFWIGDSNSGMSTYYTAAGVRIGGITIPPGYPGTLGQPTGVLYNPTADFQISQNGNTGPAEFLFATWDGTISGWNASVNYTSAVIIVNRSFNYSWFGGLALGKLNGANYLYAADNTYSKVRMYDGSFNELQPFGDDKLTGFDPYNIQNIKGKLYVTWVDNQGHSAVDVFDTAGNLIKPFTRDKHLQYPWGMALAPKNFGPASKTLLIADFGTGYINEFDFKTGKLLGQLKDKNGKVIKIGGLWGITFGDGGGQNGFSNQLFFAAGPNDEEDGLFGVIEFK